MLQCFVPQAYLTFHAGSTKTGTGENSYGLRKLRGRTYRGQIIYREGRGRETLKDTIYIAYINGEKRVYFAISMIREECFLRQVMTVNTMKGICSGAYSHSQAQGPLTYNTSIA